jgi:hypothetical protein
MHDAASRRARSTSALLISVRLGTVRTMQAFEAEAVTQNRFARTNFEATRFAATARATLDPANLRRQFALVPWDLIILSAASPKTSALSGRRPRPTRCAEVATKAAADLLHLAAARRIDTSVGKRGVRSPAPRYWAREERTRAAA